MAEIRYLGSMAKENNEYEELYRLFSSSYKCACRCDPDFFPHVKKLCDIVGKDKELQYGLLTLLKNFKVAVEQNVKFKESTKD
jgi:hypothetical protein